MWSIIKDMYGRVNTPGYVPEHWHWYCAGVVWTALQLPTVANVYI